MSVKSATIVMSRSHYQKPVEHLPGPGHHDKHLIPFGGDITHKMDFGEKYKFKVSDTPSASKYNPDDSFLSTRKRSPCVLIREPTMMASDQDLMLPPSPPRY